MDLVDLTKSKMTEGRLKKSDQITQCKNLMLGTNTNRIQFCGVFVWWNLLMHWILQWFSVYYTLFTQQLELRFYYSNNVYKATVKHVKNQFKTYMFLIPFHLKKIWKSVTLRSVPIRSRLIVDPRTPGRPSFPHPTLSSTPSFRYRGRGIRCREGRRTCLNRRNG